MCVRLQLATWASRVAAGVARDLRHDLFKHVESFSAAEFNKFSTASLITRSTNDITQVQTVTFMVMRMVIYAPILGVGAIIRAMGKGAEMSWIIAAGVMAILTLIAIVFVVALPKFKVIQDLIDKLNLVTRENLSGMMVIRAFNKQAFEEKRFDKANVDLTKIPVVHHPGDGDDDAGDDAGDEWLDDPDHLGRFPPGGGGQYAGRRYDGLHAVCHADRDVLPDDDDDVHLPAEGGCFR